MSSTARTYIAIFIGVLIIIIAGVSYRMHITLVPPVPQPQALDQTTPGWVTAPVTSTGVRFQYPSDLHTTYVHTAEWPPKVAHTAQMPACTPEAMSANSELPGKVESRSIGGKSYCVATTSEGAAGSTYTTYTYSTDLGDYPVQLAFTLRAPQCANYDEPAQTECVTEEQNFDIDGLADGIVRTIPLPN